MNKPFFVFVCFLLATLLLSPEGFAQNKYQVACVGFYNLENLFDTLDTPNKNDADFLPTGSYNYTSAVYNEKLGNLSKVISEIGVELSPDGVAILGVAEIENRAVLVDLAAQPALKARNYQIVHEESPDDRGVDVALLYNPKYFKELEHKAIPVKLISDSGHEYYSRDILWVKGLLGTDTLHVFVNHWPSRRGGEKKSSPKRQHAAAQAKVVIDSIMKMNPNSKVMLMGDLNDDPSSKSVRDVIMAKRKIDQVTEAGFYNPWWDKYASGDGTLAWNDSWNLFDQIIVSKAFLDKEQNGFFYKEAQVFRKSYLLQKEGRFKGYPYRTYVAGTYQGGYSDHLPVYIYLLKKID